VTGTGTYRSSCSSIHLEKSQLPMLIRALPFVTDPTDRALLSSIIATLRKVGSIEQSDLERITDDLGVNRSFYSGTVSVRGDFGKAYFFPRLLPSFWFSHYGSGAILRRLPAVCSYWTAIDDPDYNRTAWCDINGDTIVQGNNNGIVIGGIGGFKRESGEELGYPYFEYYAVAVLIIVQSPV